MMSSKPANNFHSDSPSVGEKLDQSKMLQPSLLLPPYDPNPSKTFFSQNQSNYVQGGGLLWNTSAANLGSTVEESSAYSSPIDEVQFQLPSFMNPPLFHPTPLKHSMLGSLTRLQDLKDPQSGSETHTNNSSFQNINDDFFNPETMTKASTTDHFKYNVNYVADSGSQPLESNYAPKKRYTMNYNAASFNPLSTEPRTKAIEQKPLYSQYAPRNPSHGSFGMSSGTVSQGLFSQRTASRGAVAHGMMSPRLLQYQPSHASQTPHTSHTSRTTNTNNSNVQSVDDEGIEAIKMELLYKDQLNKSLTGNLAELKANYDKLKATNESAADGVSMPVNFHQLFKDLTRTLNERTQELDDTKARLEAVLVGLAMSKDKTLTNHGLFDAQELAHRITNKMAVLRAENTALLDMVSFGNKQSLMVELGLLRAENKALKEKMQNETAPK